MAGSGQCFIDDTLRIGRNTSFVRVTPYPILLFLFSLVRHHLVGLVVKVSASRAADPGFVPGIFQVESYQGLKDWRFSGFPARHQAI